MCIIARNMKDGWSWLNVEENESVTIDRLEQVSGQSTDSYTDHEQKKWLLFLLIEEKEEEKKKRRKRKREKSRF